MGLLSRTPLALVCSCVLMPAVNRGNCQSRSGAGEEGRDKQDLAILNINKVSHETCGKTPQDYSLEEAMSC